MTKIVDTKWLAGRTYPAELLLSITAICWLAAKLIGWKVWVKARTFPVIAPFDLLENIPAPIHWISLFASVILLCYLVLRPANRLVQIALFVTEIFSCLLDENRWQPWEYLYLFILLVFIFNRANKQSIFAIVLITLSVVYVYSGIHKLNGAFVTSMWQNTILRRFLNVSPAAYQNRWLHLAGYLLPLVETCAGIGLLVSPMQKISAWFLIVMHLFILLLIGPLGLHYNKIVWPWNIAMIIFLYVLANQNKVCIYKNFIDFTYRTKIALMAWAVLPALNFIGWWDNYLSWKLYSSNLPAMAICIRDTMATAPLSAYYNSKVTSTICNGNAMLNLQRWAMAEMNVPPYPEQRVYKKIETFWNKTYPSSGASFVIYYYPFIRVATTNK